MDYFKIILLGDSNTGKSSILNQLVNNKFQNDYNLTIGVDYGVKTYNIDNREINSADYSAEITYSKNTSRVDTHDRLMRVHTS